jgi:hypothetical protein
MSSYESVQRHFINGGASSNEIAWLMFITDPEVKAFAAQKTESASTLAVFSTMWKRDDNGWRSKFTAKAKEMSLVEIQRGSPWALPGAWEICTCRWDESIKNTRRDPACKFFHYAFSEVAEK